ncbi:MAG: hypothetical protein ACR2F2_06040 [Pyrinomonadaceae bacterium]
MNNIKTKSAARPDRAMFLAMMGAFFIFFSLPAFYWAVYNFGQYNQTNAFVQKLRDNSGKAATPTERQENSERISNSVSRANRYRLEMLLSGAGGLVLFGIAALLFLKSFKAKKRKNFYETVDPRTIPIPAQSIEIKYKKLYAALFGLILIFFGGMLLLILYQNFTSQFSTFENALLRSLMIGVPIILLLAILSFLMIRAKRNAVRLITNSGISRGDGRHFAWNEFCGVITQTAFNRRTQRKYVWRVEFAFSGGETAWLIPNRIKNYEEVFDYLSKLPAAIIKNPC